MKNKSLAFAAALLTSSSLLFAQQAAPSAPAKATPAAPVGTPKPAAPPQAPDVAAPKINPDGTPQAGFIAAHERFVELAKKGDIGVVFLGDSITAGWGGAKEVWEKSFSQYKPVNFGIGGDRTQHVLWRIQNGELDGISPKALVLMIGTNNSGADPAEGTANGVKKIVETIRQKCPNTKILLLAIFPRGNVVPNPGRTKNEAVNAIISKLDDGKHVFYLDIGKSFLKDDGTFKDDISKDYLHFNANGYQIEADAIKAKLAELMK